ncbi:NF041680 family putative transposase [Actinokineospora sp.]|uniref:NF041680 family putative transposase n=1 Tax=Actinokineospora sp. TaxID=1872133 RepID=UPI003D6B8DF2
MVETDPVACHGRLIAFRLGLYACLGRRGDALFDLVDAVLTAGGPVGSLVGLSEEKAFRRGHGALYDALACGGVDTGMLAGLIASSWRPVDAGPVKIAVDVSPWPRPDAVTSPGLCHCHTSCRCDGTRKTVPGWPFSFAAGLEWGPSSWTALLDAVRIDPGDDATVATFEQVKRVIGRLSAAGAVAGRPAAVFAFDSGYDLTRIAWLAAQDGLDVQILGRVRSDRVFYGPAPAARVDGKPGRPPRHGARFALALPDTLPAPDERIDATSRRYGAVQVTAWHGLHQKLGRQAGWQHHTGQLPVLGGTVIRVQVERLPGDRAPKPVWLWHHAPGSGLFDLDLLWKTYLRRFDIEHTFRLLKQTLGWTAPQIRTPAQGERWTWLIVAAHTQLRLARALTGDLRRAWDKPIPAGQPITPGRVRRGFPILRRKLGTPARRPKPTAPGPGRPRGSTRPPRRRYPVGKNKPTTDTSPPSTADQEG